MQGRVNRFKRRFDGLASLAAVETVSDSQTQAQSEAFELAEKSGPKIARRKKAKK